MAPAVNVSAPLPTTMGRIGLGIMFDHPGRGFSTTNFTMNHAMTMEAGNTTTSYIYRSQLVTNSASNNNTTIQGWVGLVFSFSNASQTASLYSTTRTLEIPAGSVKWSIQINASAPFQDGLNMSFSLSDLSSSSSIAPPNATICSVTSNSSGITGTTYYLPLITQQEEPGTPVGLLQVLDWALVDGRLMAIDYSVLPSSSSSSSSSAGYTLVLQFPAFNRTLEYDPSVNLGLLVGQQSGSSSGGGPNIGLIVGATVGISVTVVVIGLIITIGMGVSIASRKRRHTKLKSLGQRLSGRSHQL